MPTFNKTKTTKAICGSNQISDFKKNRTSKLFILSLLTISLMLLFSEGYAERYKSKFFNKKIDLSSNLAELKNTLPRKTKMLNTLFQHEPVFTNVQVNIRVSENTVQKMFSNLDFTAKRSHRFTKIPYEVLKVNNKLYEVVQKPNLKGKLEVLYSNPANRRFIYRVTGTYDTFIIIRGEMIVDVRYEINGDEIDLNALTYIVLSNKYVWETTKVFRIFSKLGKKIDKIIDFNISNIVKLGRRTALDIHIKP